MTHLYRLLALALACAVAACSASSVRTQAQIAHTTATALNRVLPVWLAEADAASVRAGRAACDPDAGAPRDCRALAYAAQDAERARWRRVAVAWDVAAASHDSWRVTLERCRAAHSDTCAPGLDAAAEYVRAVGTWRCAVRAIGHAEWDPLPGSPSCGDGGAS